MNFRMDLMLIEGFISEMLKYSKENIAEAQVPERRKGIQKRLIFRQYRRDMKSKKKFDNEQHGYAHYNYQRNILAEISFSFIHTLSTT